MGNPVATKNEMKKTTQPTPAPATEVESDVPFEEDAESKVNELDDELEDSIDEDSDYPADLSGTIRTMFKECTDKVLKAKVRDTIAEYGKLVDVDEDGLKRIYDMMK